MKRVLVAGATGYLGHYVVKQFKKQGYWVRALTRSADRLDECQITGVSAPPDNSKDAPLVYGKSAPLIYGHIHPGQR